MLRNGTRMTLMKRISADWSLRSFYFTQRRQGAKDGCFGMLRADDTDNAERTRIERIKTDWSLRSDNGTRITRVTRIARRDGCSVIGTQIERISADWSLRSFYLTQRRQGAKDGCFVMLRADDTDNAERTRIKRIKADWSLRSDNGTRMARITRMARRDGRSVIGTQIELMKTDWSLRSDNGTRITRMARRDGCFGMERG